MKVSVYLNGKFDFELYFNTRKLKKYPIMTQPRYPVFFSIKLFFGHEEHKIGKYYCEATLRKTNIQETLTLNKRCKRNRILPRSFKQRPHIRTRDLQHTVFRVAYENGLRYLTCHFNEGYKN